jgi:hypothetical protein
VGVPGPQPARGHLTVADDATVVDAVGGTGVIARAGNHRAVGTLYLYQATREEQWLWNADVRVPQPAWANIAVIGAFGFYLGLIGKAGSSEEDETTAGEDEEVFRSHSGLLAKEASNYQGGNTGPAEPASSAQF